MDDALAQAEESVRLNPRRLRVGDPAAGLRDGVSTLERAATDIRMLARSVADSARIDSEHTPVKEAETRARLAAMLAELSAAVRAYGQLLETDPVSADFSGFAAEPITEALEDHLEEAERQQDQLADLLSPTRPDGPIGAAAGRDPGPRGPAALRARAPHLPEPAQASRRCCAVAAGAAQRRERHRSERHEQRVAPGSGGGLSASGGRIVGDRAAAAAEPVRPAGEGQADRVPGRARRTGGRGRQARGPSGG